MEIHELTHFQRSAISSFVRDLLKPAIQTKIQKTIAEGGGSEVLALAGGNPAKVSGWMIMSAAKAGDKACAAIVEQAANYLGLGSPTW